MPNWIFNTVMLTGPTDRIDELVKRLGRPVPVDASGATEERALSFWNLIAPTDLAAYFDEDGVGAWSNPLGWYSWNNQHWGCKWDAHHVRLEVDDSDGVSVASYSFDTPWGPPEPIFDSLEEICRAQGLLLWVRVEDEEDRQWTFSLDGRTGVTEVVDLDVPESHADYVARGLVCRCELMRSGTPPTEDEWLDGSFMDCPAIRGRCSSCDEEVLVVEHVLISVASGSQRCTDGGAHALPEVPSIAESAASFLRCFGEAL